MKFNPNSVFFGAVVCGLVASGLSCGLVASSDPSFSEKWQVRLWAPVVSVIVLLFFHRYAYLATINEKLRRLADGRVMSQSALADACYYLGFIFTLFILFSAFVVNTQMGKSGTPDLIPILTQFSMGLFTTGYGLVARIHLSMLTDTEEANPDELRERLNLRTRQLIGVIEDGMHKVSSAVEKANVSIVKSTLTVDEQLTARADSLTKEIKTLTGKIKQQVEGISFEVEVSNIKTSLFGLGEVLSTANETTSAVALSIRKSTELQDEKVAEIVRILTLLATSANATATTFGKLNAQYLELGNTLEKHSGVLTSSTVATDAYSALTEQLATKVAGLSAASDGLGVTFAKSAGSVSSLHSESEVLFQRLQAVSAELQRLGPSISSLNLGIGEIVSRVKARFIEADDIVSRSAQSTLRYGQNIVEAGRASSAFSASLTAISGHAEALCQKLIALEERIAVLDRGFQQTISKLAEITPQQQSVISKPKRLWQLWR